ncbi:MAG: triose-phosphate isomerase [Verrucomicrobia subdivision 3 bacterium]|nr:triose-phosphate isomerase [Limisphaerales bacterium]
MNKDRKLIVAGNWKMNKTVAEATELVEALKLELANQTEVDVVLCPPFTALERVSAGIRETRIRLGAQNMSEQDFGAFTGEIAAGMLRELLVHFVILGHSERRAIQKESDALVNAKAKAALAAGLKPIVCVGETLAQREGNQTEEVVGEQIRGSLTGLTDDQLRDTIIAYEPVWAIGTGKTATTEQAQAAHAFIRGQLPASVSAEVRIQYGGSVKPDNARELMSQPDVDGALVGGASLEAKSFIEIITNTLN